MQQSRYEHHRYEHYIKKNGSKRQRKSLLLLLALAVGSYSNYNIGDTWNSSKVFSRVKKRHSLDQPSFSALQPQG